MAPFLEKFFPEVYHKQALQHTTNQYCTFDSHILTLFTSSLYGAALVASFGASWVTKRCGRKWTMFIGGAVFLAGSILNGLAIHIAMLIIGRILLGVGVGFATQVILNNLYFILWGAYMFFLFQILPFIIRTICPIYTLLYTRVSLP